MPSFNFRQLASILIFFLIKELVIFIKPSLYRQIPQQMSSNKYLYRSYDTFGFENFIDILELFIESSDLHNDQERYNMKKQDEKTFKMIIIGPPGVGKSCLLNRFTKDQFKQGYTATLGVQFYSKEIKIDEENSIKMQIWDTAGQESFRSIIKTFYRSSAAVFLVYNITNMQSFEELQHWYTEAIENCSQNSIFALIGAQKDRENERAVSLQKAQKFMKDKDLAFMFETSSKTSENVEIAFREAAKQIILKKISMIMPNPLPAPRPVKKCEC